jgi:predicted CopG family antitoxin
METMAIQVYVESYRQLEAMKRPKGIKKYETFADVVQRLLESNIPSGKD